VGFPLLFKGTPRAVPDKLKTNASILQSDIKKYIICDNI
jgi:hypothetical protein